MTVTVVTKATGATSAPLATVYVPEEVAQPAPTDGVFSRAKLDATFVFDLLSACLAHERCGAHLYRSVAGRTADPDLRERYEHFGAETVEHVELLERLIAAAGGDPGYVSPAARATERAAAALLESTFMLSGSADVVVAETTLLEAVMLAEAKDHANWQLLAEVATLLPESDELRAEFDEVTSRVLRQEDEHYGWARETLATIKMAVACAPGAGKGAS